MKEKKPVKCRSRRRRALRHTLIALIAMLLCNQVLHVGFLLPWWAERNAEERAGIYERTRFVSAQWVPEMHLAHRLYLTAGEQSTTLTSVNLGILGWSGSFAWPIDCAESAPVHAGYVAMSRDDHDDQLFFYGRVDSARVAEVECITGYQEYSEDPAQPMPLEIVRAERIPREAWAERDGYGYFLLQGKLEEWSRPDAFARQWIAAYDAEGKLLYQEMIEAGASVFWG